MGIGTRRVWQAAVSTRVTDATESRIEVNDDPIRRRGPEA
jgi:hypothetical protein